MASKKEPPLIEMLRAQLGTNPEAILDELSEVSRWYILDEKNKPKRATIREWTNWRMSDPPNFHAGSTQKGKVWVSTAFLGLDHSYNYLRDKRRPPILFETMIFDKRKNGEWKARSYQTRCATWKQALEMHKEALKHAWEPKIL